MGLSIAPAEMQQFACLRVPDSAPPVWLRTPPSRLMSSAISDFVAAGVLRRGVPSHCYRLFAVPKSADTARLVYDLSSLTPFMPRRPCHLPSVTRAVNAAAAGFRFAIKIDLRDGFYHIPLSKSCQHLFGVLYNETYAFEKLPMGLSIAPAEMQQFACTTVKLIESHFLGVLGLAFLDDFLFLSRRTDDLCGVSAFLSDMGFCINEEKSVLRPTSVLVYLGLELDLSRCWMKLKPNVARSLRCALRECSD